MPKGQKKQLKTSRGASLVEYALLIALISIICVAAVRGVYTAISDRFSTVQSGLNP